MVNVISAETNKPEQGSRGPTTLGKRGPIDASRLLLASVRKLNVVAISYHVASRHLSLKSTLPHLHFDGEKSYSRHQLPDDQAKVIGAANDSILKYGKPTILSQLLPTFEKIEPELTKAIMSTVNEMGVYDQFMVPVFGAYNTNGVLSYGFNHRLAKTETTLFRELENISSAYHSLMVQYFGSAKRDVELSPRETDVLKWITNGKSRGEIATILAIQPSSVDTYTRRIFDKMGVHDRVSAAVIAISDGLIFRE